MEPEQSNMTLEDALQWEQDILNDVEYLKEELIECRELIAELSEEESGNPHWTDKDETGGRMLMVIPELKQKLLDGIRADYHFAHYEPVFSHLGYFATLTEEVDPETKRMYAEATSKHFHGWVSFAVLANCYTAEGDLIEGYKIPWNGSTKGSELKSTMDFQNTWTAPNKLNALRAQAQRRIWWIDRDYRMAQRYGDMDKFNQKYPYYVTEDDWTGPE